MAFTDTIAAPSTPVGESAIALIRATGPLSPTLPSDIFKPKESLVPRRVYTGVFRNVRGQPVDHVTYCVFEKNRSYTGEDMLEIGCHGNPLIIQKIMDDLMARGCRLAEPGEFTKRAFLNGKMDLSQAEAVADLIHAKSEEALHVAEKQLSGALRGRIGSLVEQLLQAVAYLEVYIDFPDEDLPPEDQNRPLYLLQAVEKEIQSLVATARYHSTLTGGIRTVILGAPNAGKSSLLNALLGCERAIVSPIPGTTRDFISEYLPLGPYSMHLMDTAGIHDTTCEIERLGIAKTQEKAQEADFFILIWDISAPSPTLPESITHLATPHNTLVLDNKVDLSSPNPSLSVFLPHYKHHALSLKDGTGVKELPAVLLQTLKERHIVPPEDILVINLRHRLAFESALKHIDAAMDKLHSKRSPELSPLDARDAIHELETITGKIDNEAILDIVFQNFCIGK